DVDAWMHAVVVQRPDWLEARPVAHMGEARIAMAAKIALKNSTVRSAIEDRPPAFQFADAFGRFLGMQFSHAPVVDVLAAAHCVGKVHLPIVALIDVGEGR